MALQTIGVLFFFLPFFLGETGGLISVRDSLSRKVFPKDFIFGTASSSYQYEGGAFEDGKGPSVWDTFTHQHPERIDDRSNGDVAIDSYHRYKEDIDLLKNMNMDAYRFSISWPRILPNGSLSGGINKKGVEYYNNLINYLIANGMKPFVTLFHWDTPQGVEDAYGGFLSQKIVNDFRDYSEVCFKEFGDRVKHWITFNEPFSYCALGYGMGTFAPGRCSPWLSKNCKVGDSGREPYIAGQNMLLAHGVTVKLYREKYKASQKGSIGITVVSNWYIPLSKSKVNDAAVTRALDFMYGWFMNPLTYGEYPSTMRSLVGDRLPRFTKEQSLLLKGSYDFLGLNYYTTYYASSQLTMNKKNASYFTDSNTNATAFRNGKPIGPVAASPWLFLYAPGIRDVLLYTKEKYNNPVIYITENGVSEANNSTLTLKEALQDDMRITYCRQHLLYLQRAIREGVDVRGYFAWSLLDNFEWVNGYAVRFGLNYVDYKDGLKRYPKKSALWLGKLLKRYPNVALGFGPSDSSGTDDDLPPLHQNRDVRRGNPSQNERIAAISSLQYAQSIQDMETQIHQLEQEAYSSILRAFKAQADVITWEKESLMTEIRNELRVTDGEHRILLNRVNSDDLIRRIREWRQAGGGQTGFFGNGQHVHDSAPSLTVSASCMNPKASQSIPYMSMGGPLPSLHTQTVAAPSQSYSSAAKRGPPSGAEDTRPIETASSDPLIGKKVKTRWPADNNFYEALITDYNPVEGLHALVYDVNTKNETWEWINLKEISPDDIRWESEDPCIIGQGKNGAPVRGLTKTMKSGGLQGARRGRRSMENYPENDFTSSQNGTKKKGSDDIEILDTATLLNEVEKIFSSSCPDTMQIENAKRALKDQDHSLIDAIKRLADASDR